MPNEPATGHSGLQVLKVTRTTPNTFGLFREYYGELPPTSQHEPDAETALTNLMGGNLDDPKDLYAPYPNASSYRLHHWHWTTGAVKSHGNFKMLVDDVLLSEGFTLDDLRGTNWDKLNSIMGGSSTFFDPGDGWMSGQVSVSVPSGRRNVPPRDFLVGGLQYRSIVGVVRNTFGSVGAKKFHFIPYKLLWQPRTEGFLEQQIHGEYYNSPSWINEHIKLQQSPREPGCSLPRGIAAIMLWSDSTHLTDFGDRSLWPIYLQFGNQSKYTRGKPTSRAFHHLAYLPKVSQFFVILWSALTRMHEL